MVRCASRALIGQCTHPIRQRDPWLKFTVRDTGVDAADEHGGRRLGVRERVRVVAHAVAVRVSRLV